MLTVLEKTDPTEVCTSMKQNNHPLSLHRGKPLLTYLIEHYIMIHHLQQAGGLRKNLTPKKCLYSHILFENLANPLHAIQLTEDATYLANEILSIPF
jgi:hypothetical protein